MNNFNFFNLEDELSNEEILELNKDIIGYYEDCFQEIKELFERNEPAALVSATGSGKSIIISRVLEDLFQNDNKIYLSPSNDINSQYQKMNKHYHIIYALYHNIEAMRQLCGEEFLKNVKIIVTDELHRLGAKTWGPNFQKLLKLCPNAKILGATATPKRNDQKLTSYDTADLYFNSNKVGNLTLADAINKNLLPTPIYIACMYDLVEEVNIKRERISRIKNEEVREEITQRVNNIVVKFNNEESIKNIFKKHFEPLLHKDSVKILIFAKNVDHIRKLRGKLDKVFGQIFFSENLQVFEYHYQAEMENYEKFKSAKGVSIIYAVNKLNEGVHFDGLDALVLLRNTESELIYKQQIGRIISRKIKIAGKTPIIIDLVNNFSQLNYISFLQDVKFSEGAEKEKRERTPKDMAPNFYDYTVDIRKVFEEIDIKIENNSDVFELKNGFRGTINQICRKYDLIINDVFFRVTDGQEIDYIVDILIKEKGTNCYGFVGTIDEIAKHFKVIKSVVIWKMNGSGVEGAKMTIEEAVAYNRENFNPDDYSD